MKQILQDMTSGGTTVTEAPTLELSSNTLIINTRESLISAGTERMSVGFGKASYSEKARQQPDKVKMVLEKVVTDGLMTTVDAIKSKLGQPLPLGYCNVGVVSEVGGGAAGFKAGDRVVSNGLHADVVRVSKNLCARIPDSVTDEEASFTVVASIGLQGVRLAKPTLGEAFVVTGVGLIGLLTAQLLRAHGCRVLAIDFDETKLELARQLGAKTCNPAKGEGPVAAGMAFSRGQGVDGVIITASTKSNDPIIQAACMSRKRGRIILVGVSELELNCADFYEKELTFQVSCSYGPGRYDPFYEDKGQDYPLPFVRWTEQRSHNSHARFVAQALEAGKHVFVEKPLAIDFAGLEQVEIAYKAAHDAGSGPQLMVGFNRRFSPQVQKMKALLDPVKEPKSFIMTMNVGAIPADHWTQVMAVGGGRIIGESCHFIDLMRYLAGSEIISVQARRMGDHPGVPVTEDKASITLGFADGSFGTILYLANGASSFPKERVEVFAAGGVPQLDNLRKLKGFGWKGFKKMNLRKQDKSQNACATAFLEGIQAGKPAIPVEEIFEVARVSIEAAELLRNQQG